MSRFLSVLSAVGLLVVSSGADWPTYRGDAARSGYTAEKLAREAVAGLDLPAAARPAAGLAARRPHAVRPGARRGRRRRRWCSSAARPTGRVVALDAATGQERWTFFTDAPVRFAPAVWKDRVFAASDDGYLYCLSLADGSLIQRWRGGPSDEMILGNGRMVSRWPARGGPVIRDGIVYFAAGIWQSDGIFLHGHRRRVGPRVLWRNDEAGKIYMPQPHGGAMAESGVSAQGYLVATADTLLVPTGRAVPAAFSRAATASSSTTTCRPTATSAARRPWPSAAASTTAARPSTLATGELEGKLGAGAVAAHAGRHVVHGGKRELRVLKVVEKTVPDRKGAPAKALVHEAGLVAARRRWQRGGDRRRRHDRRRRRQRPSRPSMPKSHKVDLDDRSRWHALRPGRRQRPALRQHRPRHDLLLRRRSREARRGSSRARKPQPSGRTLRRRGRRDHPPHRREGRLLPRPGLRRRQPGDRPGPADEPADLRPLPIGRRSRRRPQAAQRGGPVRRAHHRPLRETRPRCRYGKYFADLVVSAARSTADRSAITADNPPADAAAQRRHRLHGPARRDAGLHAPAAGQDRQLDASVLRPGQHELLGRRSGARAAARPVVPRRRSGNAAAARPRPRAAVLRGADVRRRARTRCGPSMPTTAATCGSSRCPAFRPPTTPTTSPAPPSPAATSASPTAGVYVHDKQRCYRLDAATGKKLGEFPRRRRRPTASRASGATSPATASCSSARWPIRSTRCATPTCGPT